VRDFAFLRQLDHVYGWRVSPLLADRSAASSFQIGVSRGRTIASRRVTNVRPGKNDPDGPETPLPLAPDTVL